MGPKSSLAYPTHTKSTTGNACNSGVTSISDFDEKAQINRMEGSRFEALASYPDVVERVKIKDRETGEIVHAEIEQAKATIAEQVQEQSDAPVLFVGNSKGLVLPKKVDLLLTDPH